MVDALRGESGVHTVGQRILLPPTFKGSPRWYKCHYLDAMAVLARLGCKADYFVTFTCNPNWKEIQENLRPGEKASKRVDLLTDVFHEKLQALLDDLAAGVLGQVAAEFVVVEWQKRGLPHAHILVVVRDEDKPTTPEAIDRVICAEIPDPRVNQRLHRLVTEKMCHGPCGPAHPDEICMVGRPASCSKKFPKRYAEHTTLNGANYPTYRRRAPHVAADGAKLGEADVRKFNSRTRRQQTVNFTNADVIPYNPWLLAKYECHINVESVFCLEAMKYIFQYITKGNDKVNFGVPRPLRRPRVNDDGEEELIDEVDEYEQAAFISATEGFHYMRGHFLAKSTPSVVKLDVHLEGEDYVLFDDNQGEDLAGRERPSKLLAYFEFVNRHWPRTDDIKYSMVQEYAVFKVLQHPDGSKTGVWEWRKGRGRGCVDARDRVWEFHVSRMTGVALTGPTEELFRLRQLLRHKVARSFEDARTFEGTVYPTFNDACRAMGLTNDDREAESFMREVDGYQMPYQMRRSFAALLQFDPPADKRGLFDQFVKGMARDFMRRLGEDMDQEPSEAAVNMVACHIDDVLQTFGSGLHLFPDLPQPVRAEGSVAANELCETDYNRGELAASVDETLPLLNDEQRAVYDAVVSAVEQGTPRVFRLDAIGGSGKTFTSTLILNRLRSQGRVALATALSGIAAVLLPNGRTLHSRAKVPLDADSSSVCRMTIESTHGRLFRKAELLIIDEITMGHKNIFECVDRSLRGIRECPDLPFGGLTVLLAGDWRQCLPVVKREGRPGVTAACLHKSLLWEATTQLSLCRNMRVERALAERRADADKLRQWDAYLRRVGDGLVHDFDVEGGDRSGARGVKLPPEIAPASLNRDALLGFVYGDLNRAGTDGRYNFQDPAWLRERAIITGWNKEVDAINQRVLDMFPGRQKEFLSFNELEEGDPDNDYLDETLESLSPNGFPPHVLRLKKGAHVMLLRNLDPQGGHVNGARYVIKDWNRFSVVAEPQHQPGDVMIFPRITHRSKEGDFPFILRRKQFPLRLCFAVTANKSQGQTFGRVGVYLPRPLFVHGQLYVALSRVGNPDNIRVMGDEVVEGRQRTHNVVYRDVLAKTSARPGGGGGAASSGQGTAEPSRSDGDGSRTGRDDASP